MIGPQERTTDIYEEMPGHAKPPLISLPDPDDIESLERDLTGRKKHSLRFKILHNILLLLGFKKFLNGLTEEALEGLLRRTDLRQLGQPALSVSATVNLADDPRDVSPIERTATILLAARQLHGEIRSGSLASDCYRDQPLEMGQYPNLFATSLIWNGGRKPRFFKSTDTTHFNLVVGRRFYSLDVGNETSEASIASLAEGLNGVVERTKRNPLGPDETSLGLLSCANPRTQRKAFRIMQKKELNRKNLEVLRHSVLTICLDLDHMPETDSEAAHIAHSQNLQNRWHHSSLQLVIFGNSKACAIFKFDAALDGNIMMRGAAEIQKRAVCLDLHSPKTSTETSIPSVTELTYKINKPCIIKAGKEVRLHMDNQTPTFYLPEIGRHFFQAHSVDAISAFMLSLHMTIFHFTGKAAMVEQAVTMSKFRCMGLTTANTTTPETKSFTEYVSKNDIHSEKAWELMQSALESQKQACRHARRALPFSQLIPLFLASLRGFKKINKLVFAVTRMLLGIKWSSDVIVSHPAIFPEATMLGRPGARLPYLNYFGLHYRMEEDNITITMMPSIHWSISNAELISVLEKKLETLKSIILDVHADNDKS